MHRARATALTAILYVKFTCAVDFDNNFGGELTVFKFALVVDGGWGLNRWMDRSMDGSMDGRRRCERGRGSKQRRAREREQARDLEWLCVCSLSLMSGSCRGERERERERERESRGEQAEESRQRRAAVGEIKSRGVTGSCHGSHATCQDGGLLWNSTQEHSSAAVLRVV